jgi:hypothetical protein
MQDGDLILRAHKKEEKGHLYNSEMEQSEAKANTIPSLYNVFARSCVDV